MNIDLLFSNFELLNTPEKVQKLKQAILQLAVQGKLVPQDPTDEPASELIRNIKAEKAKLIKEGKLKKERPLPPISEDEIPYELPKGWEWVRLGETIIFYNGFAFKSNEFSDKGAGIVRIGDIQEGKIVEDFMKYYPSELVNKISPEYHVNHGDLLIAMSGATTGKLGFNLSNKRYLLNQRVGKIEPLLIDTHYLYLYLTTKITQHLSISFGSAIPNLSTNQIKNSVFSLPPLKEQKRIVEKVDQLFSRVDEIESKLKKADGEIVHLNKSALNQLLESKDGEEFKKNFQFINENFDLLYSDERNVKELRQAILQLAVQGKLVPQDPTDEPATELLKQIKAEKERPIQKKKIKREQSLPPISDDEIPHELPKGWAWARFGDIANIASNITDPNLFPDLPHIAPNSIEKSTGKLIGCNTVKEDNVISPNHHFYSGQILYSKIRPNLSKAVVVDFQGLCSADMYPIDSLIDTHYLLIYILSQTFLSKAIRKDTRVAMPKINQAELNKILIALPPFNEQKRIVPKVDELMKLCDELEEQLKQSKEESERLVQAVLQEVLEGKYSEEVNQEFSVA